MHGDVQKRDSIHLSPVLNNTQKRYLWSTEELLQQNKFSVQGNSSQVTDDTLSTPPPTQDTVATSPKIPPIFLNALNYREIINDIKNIVKKSFTISSNINRIKINLTDIEDFRTLTAYYVANQIKFYTYQEPTSKPLSIVIKSVPISLTANDIESELQTLGLPVLKVDC